MKLTLTFVRRTERTSKNTGKPFTSISIKCSEYGDKYLSGFGNKDNASWKEGDTVEVEKVEQKGEYLNFEMPKVQKNTGGMTLAQGEEMLIRMAKMNYMLERIYEKIKGDDGLTSAGTKQPDFDDLGVFDEKDIPSNF